jgi:hypothetical protein
MPMGPTGGQQLPQQQPFGMQPQFQQVFQLQRYLTRASVHITSSTFCKISRHPCSASTPHPLCGSSLCTPCNTYYNQPTRLFFIPESLRLLACRHRVANRCRWGPQVGSSFLNSRLLGCSRSGRHSSNSNDSSNRLLNRSSCISSSHSSLCYCSISFSRYFNYKDI